MEPSFYNEECDVFINENEIKMEEKIKGERFEKGSKFLISK
jgi:hypothetical protein